MSDGQLIGFREDTATGKNIRGVTYDYPLPVDDPKLLASRGIGNVSSIVKFGTNPQIDTSTDPETIWTTGGLYVKQTVAETVNIASDNAADSVSGTGARTLIVFYLTTNYVEATEIVTLNGTSNVALSSPCIAINRMACVTSGSNKTNVGIITATGASSGDVHAQITVFSDDGSTRGAGITHQLVYTVPAGKNAVLDLISLATVRTSGGATPTVTFWGIVESEIGTQLMVFHEKIDTRAQTRLQLEQPVAPVIGEKTTLRIDAVTNTNNTYASGRMYIRLIDV